MNNIRRLAFIGGGNMAAALIGGLTKRGLPSERVVVADPSQEQLRASWPVITGSRPPPTTPVPSKVPKSWYWPSNRSRCAPWPSASRRTWPTPIPW